MLSCDFKGENSIVNEVSNRKVGVRRRRLARVDGTSRPRAVRFARRAGALEAREDIHADLLEVSSPRRSASPPPCPHFADCGGCHYQHAPYEYQLARKIEILREQLRRVGKLDYQGEIERGHAASRWPTAIARSFTSPMEKSATSPPRSHDLVALPGDCPIASPRLNQALALLRERLPDRRFPHFVTPSKFSPMRQDVQFNVLEYEKPVAKTFYEWMESTVALTYPTKFGTFRVSPRSFFQVNRFLIEALVDAAVQNVDGKSALDLYAGVGLFARPLTEKFESVAAVEAGASAVRDLEVNVPKVKWEHARVEDYIAKLDKAPDFVLADPPRAGLGKSVVANLNRLAPPRITIVSCDPATLARDLAGLKDYQVEQLTLVDLFPQTYHLETVARLLRK